MIARRHQAAMVRWMGLEEARRLTAYPMVILLVIVGLDLENGRETVTGPIVIVPLFAANLVGPYVTSLYAALTLLTAGVLGIYDGQYADPAARHAQVTRLVLIAAGGLLAVATLAVRMRREARLAAVQRVADVAQRAVLPKVPPRLGSLTLAAHYESAAVDASIGGDLYAAVDTPCGVRLLVADVRGKGLDAVRLATVVLGSFRERAHERQDLSVLLEDLHAAVRRSAGDEDFVTGVIVQVDSDGRLSLANAGHPEPLLTRDGQRLDPPCHPHRPPLGIESGETPDGGGRHVAAGAAPTRQMLPGDRLLLFTDGLTEARRPADREFSPPRPPSPPR